MTPDVKRYEGFTSPAAQTVAVDGNGNTVIEYKYARNIHKLKLVDRGVDENNMEGFGMPFGAAITEVAIGMDIALKAGIQIKISRIDSMEPCRTKI